MKVLCAATACLVLAGCASSSADIGATYSSPLLYSSYSCRALAYQDQELTARVTALTGQLNRRATNDKIAMGVAVVAFWPAVFFVKGDGEQAAEYARLKGEHDAITKASTMRGCLSGSQADEAAYAPAPPLQPYQPQPVATHAQVPFPPPATALAPYVYARAASAPLPTGTQPLVQAASEVPGQVHIDNYGRQQP